MPQDYDGLQVEKIDEGSIKIDLWEDTERECWGRTDESSYSCIPNELVKKAIKKVLSDAGVYGEKIYLAFYDTEKEDWKRGQYEDHWELSTKIIAYYGVISNSTKDGKTYLIPMEIEIYRYLYVSEYEEERLISGERFVPMDSYDVVEVREVRYEIYEVLGGFDALKSWPEFEFYYPSSLK